VAGLILAVGLVVILLVAFNARGIRGRIPMLRSPNKVVAAAGWSLLVLVWLTVAGLAAPPTPTSPSTSGPPSALKPSTATSPSPRATASPSPVATPTPTQTVATPAPTQKAVVAAATPKPTVRATAPPPPAAFNYCGAPSNPWHYNFCGGSVIYSPPSNFCTYFSCIANFWHEDIPNDGYVIQCADGMFSLSGGEAGGVCSYHGGPRRSLYAP